MKRYVCLLVCILYMAVLLSGCKTSLEEAFGYTSSAIIFLVENEDNVAEQGISHSDLITGQRLVETCISICYSDRVFEKVKESSGISDGFTMCAEAVPDSQLIEISVSSWDKQTAYDVCAAYTKAIPEAISEIVPGLSVKIVELPKMPA